MKSKRVRKEELQNSVFQALNDFETTDDSSSRIFFPIKEKILELETEQFAEIFCQVSTTKRYFLIDQIKEIDWKKVAKYCVENDEIEKISEIRIKTNLHNYYLNGTISFEDYCEYLDFSEDFCFEKGRYYDYQKIKKVILLNNIDFGIYNFFFSVKFKSFDEDFFNVSVEIFSRMLKPKIFSFLNIVVPTKI